MSFRNRLRLFFLAIVLLPMIAVGAVLFVLLGGTESGKADAGGRGADDVARQIYRDVRDRAPGRPGGSRPTCRSRPRCAATTSRRCRPAPPTCSRARGVQRIVVVKGGNRALVDVGNAAANLPGSSR